jgi:hypothetical protein
MRSSVLLVPVLAMTVSAGQVFGQFAAPVQPNTLNYGPGRIDVTTAWQYIGRTVTACGRAAQTDPRSPNLVMGVSPYETVVIFPPDTDPQTAERFNGQIICVTGDVEQPQQFMMGVRAVLYPQHIEAANEPPPVHASGPCIDQHGMVHGRATYGGPARQGPLPPC